MTTSVQTSYDNEPGIGYAGQLADDGDVDVASMANSSATGIVAGTVVLRSGDRLCRPILTTDTPVLDTDSIATAIATATTPVIATGATLDGVIGVTEISPPTNIVLTLNSHADWDPSTILVRGLDWKGAPCEEAFEVPNGGNVTLTGNTCFSFVTEVYIPAQTGTNGTLDVGTGVKIGPIGKLVAGIALYNSMREPGTFARYEGLSVIRKGRVKVSAEGAVTSGGPVYVRFVVAGNEVYGAMLAAPDSTDCGLLPGARWASTTTGAGIAVVDLNLPS